METQLRAVARSIVTFTDERQLAFQKLIIAESRRDPTRGEAAFKAGKGAHMTWFVGLVREFCVWSKVMGLAHSLGLTPPVETVIDEAIATFMARYGIGDEAAAGEP